MTWKGQHGAWFWCLPSRSMMSLSLGTHYLWRWSRYCHLKLTMNAQERYPFGFWDSSIMISLYSFQHVLLHSCVTPLSTITYWCSLVFKLPSILNLFLSQTTLLPLHQALLSIGQETHIIPQSKFQVLLIAVSGDNWFPYSESLWHFWRLYYHFQSAIKKCLLK